ATEVSSTLETVQTQVQNSAVGTNLLLNTGDDNDATHPVKMLTGYVSVLGDLSRTKEYSQITAPPSGSYEMYYRFGNPLTNEMYGLEPGQTYTIQGKVYVSKGSVHFRFSINMATVTKLDLLPFQFELVWQSCNRSWRLANTTGY
ncbi:hypothetical protein WP50_08570, partial [Lactiplantibacillus plantarum]